MLKARFALPVLLAVAGCATPPPPALPLVPPPAALAAPPAAPQPAAKTPQTDAMAAYGFAMIHQLNNDLAVQQILASCEVGQAAAIGIVVDPSGYVDHVFMVKSSLPANVETLLTQHIIYVNFGAFPAGFPNRQLTFLLPLHPPANPAAVPPPAADLFSTQNIVLYQPNAVLVNRLSTAAPMAFYIKQVEGSLNGLLASQPAEAGFSAALVIGIKPGGLTRAWLVGDVPPALASQITTVTMAVPSFQVQNGPVAVAIEFSAWGGGGPLPPGPPIPPEWLQGAPGPQILPDDAFARVWP